VGRRLRTLQTESAILGQGISDADVTTLLAGWVQTATLKEGSKVLAAGQRAAHVIYVLTGSLRGIDMADAHVRSFPRFPRESLHCVTGSKLESRVCEYAKLIERCSDGAGGPRS
jgi:hypothetical protein